MLGGGAIEVSFILVASSALLVAGDLQCDRAGNDDGASESAFRRDREQDRKGLPLTRSLAHDKPHPPGHGHAFVIASENRIDGSPSRFSGTSFRYLQKTSVTCSRVACVGAQ